MLFGKCTEYLGYKRSSDLFYVLHYPLEITYKFSLFFPSLVVMGSRIVNKFHLRLEFTVTASVILEGCVERDSKAVSQGTG